MKITGMRLARTTVLLIVGIAGIVYETLFKHPADYVLVVGFFSMCGLPLFLPGGSLNVVPAAPVPVAPEAITPAAEDP